MKRIRIMLLFVCLSNAVGAQTFSEWFRQKSTQKKYLLEQIAALKVYGRYVQKGYSIAKDGLGMIGDLKNGELNLHHVFYDGLSLVSPKVRHYHKIAGIIDFQAAINREWNSIRSALASDGNIPGDRKAYFNRVFDRLNDDCLDLLDELLTVTTNGRVKMSDDERVRWIDRLHQRMVDNYQFCKGYGNELRQWAAQQRNEERDILNSRRLNGIKP